MKTKKNYYFEIFSVLGAIVCGFLCYTQVVSSESVFNSSKGLAELVDGELARKPSGELDFKSIHAHSFIYNLDMLRSNPPSDSEDEEWPTIRLQEKAQIRIKPGSILKISHALNDLGGVRVELFKGEIEFHRSPYWPLVRREYEFFIDKDKAKLDPNLRVISIRVYTPPPPDLNPTPPKVAASGIPAPQASGVPLPSVEEIKALLRYYPTPAPSPSPVH